MSATANSFIQIVPNFLQQTNPAAARDVTFHPLWILAIVAFLIVFFLIIFLLTRLGWVKHAIITNDPSSIFHYLLDTVRKHWIAYLVFSLLPLLLGVVFKINVLNIFGILGFLLTSLSAFYATKAERASTRAFDEARRTYNTVVEFADSLEMFNDNVRYRLEELTKRNERISLKFLTVIPAFGAVGLEDVYLKRRLTDPLYLDFPRFLCMLVQSQVSREKFWNIEILTHNHTHVSLWLENIYEASIVDTVQRIKKVQNEYKEQRTFVQEFADRLVTSHYRRMRFWEPRPATLANYDKLQETGANGPRIPFQFLLVKRYVDFANEDAVARTEDDFNAVLQQDLLRVFFLFSGDFLYDFVFKVLDGKVQMSQLQQLTKGYYTDDPALLKIFNNIFWNFSKNMPCLTDINHATYFP